MARAICFHYEKRSLGKFQQIFFDRNFMPHGHCYMWEPILLWLHVGSDALIAIAYCTIPVTLIYFVRRRKDLQFNWMFVCFAVFILACGASHVMEIWTAWYPSYWLAGAIKAVTAMASIPTAILLMKLIPFALALPGPAALAASNEQLRLEISPDELMKRADIALYSAKSGGRNTQMMFDPAMQASIAMRNAMEAHVRQGLAQHHFALYYQPQVDSAGALIGVEALLRLQHPDKGLIMPAAFIGVAENTGLIFELGYWTLETACAQLHAWSSDAARAEVTISVNVSARQFSDVAFVERVLGIVERTGAEPQRLIFELTESLLLDEVETTIGKMIALRQLGIRFSLDDFGTGFSSLSYLKRLPLHEIKIDRSFVQDLTDDANDAVIVRAIIALAESFGLSVIAEGVETMAQRDFLLRSGCTRFQGYLFGRPAPVAMLNL